MTKRKIGIKNFLDCDFVKILIVLLPIALMVFLLNYLTPIYADDYYYSYVFGADPERRVNSIFDIFQSQYNHYFSMNGRTVTHFLAQLFLLIGKPYFNIINTFGFIIFGMLIYYHAFLSFKNIKILPLFFVFFSLFIAVPCFGQSFLWITGSANYLYGPILTLLFLVPYRKSMNGLKQLTISRSIVYSIGMFLLGLLAGNANENNGVTVALLSLAFIVYSLLKLKKIQVWCVTGFLGSLIGCLFMLLSPGTQSRAGEEGLKLTEFPRRVVLNTLLLFDKFTIMLIVFVILLGIYLFIHIKNSMGNWKMALVQLKTPILYFIIFLASYYSLSVPPWFPLRAWSTFIIFFIITLLTLYNKIYENCNIFTVDMFVAGCLAVLLIGVYANNFIEVQAINNISNQRTIAITKAIDDGEKSVYLPRIWTVSRFSCYNEADDLTDNYKSWQNRGVARYYNLDRVYRIKQNDHDETS